MSKSISKDLPQWVKRLIQIREDNSLSVEEMAERLRISPERLQSYEAGKVSREQKSIMHAAEQLDMELNPSKREKRIEQAHAIIGQWMKNLHCKDPRLLDEALGANGRIEQAIAGLHEPTSEQLVVWGLRVKAIMKLIGAAQRDEWATASDNHPGSLQ